MLLNDKIDNLELEIKSVKEQAQDSEIEDRLKAANDYLALTRRVWQSQAFVHIGHYAFTNKQFV